MQKATEATAAFCFGGNPQLGKEGENDKMHTANVVGGSSLRRVFRGHNLARKKITRKQLAAAAADIIDRNADYVPTQEQLAQDQAAI